MDRSIIIVGGGASGMAAAVTAARHGADVTIIEHMGRVGKKILSTGNGKCNLTNLAMPDGAYRGSDPDFAKKVLQKVSVSQTMTFFENLGIVLTQKNGYVYPNSGQASSVLDALRFELEHLGVKVIYDCEAERITGDLWVHTNLGKWQADAVILTAGSKAAKATGSDGSGYKLAEKLGHTIIKPLPALVQLRCEESFYRQLSGVRTQGEIRLLIDGREAVSDRGEIQFTDYGISGIPVFQVSRFAARALDEGKKVTASIDLFPITGRKELETVLAARVRQLGYIPAGEFLNGMINKKLASVLLKNAGINGRGTAAEIQKQQITKLAEEIKNFRTVIRGTNSFDMAQVCSGGVAVSEVNPETMKSKLIEGLYLAGELLDVDGICGGYNLQWAWSSGILAGKSAAGKIANGPRTESKTEIKCMENKYDSD